MYVYPCMPHVHRVCANNGWIKCISYFGRGFQLFCFFSPTITISLHCLKIISNENYLKFHCPLNLISLLVLALISSTTLISALANDFSNYGSRNCCLVCCWNLWTHQRGIKHSELPRYALMLLIFPNIYSEKLWESDWSSSHTTFWLLYECDLNKKKSLLLDWAM